MELFRRYGVEAEISFPLIVKDGTDVLTADPGFEVADVRLGKDGAAFQNSANNPEYVGRGIAKLVLTVAEMTAARISIGITDQTAPKDYEDQSVLISTYGAANAEHKLFLHLGTAAGASTSTITLDAAANGADDDIYNNNVVRIVAGTGAGQSRQIIAYNSSTKVATVSGNWIVTPDTTSVFDIVDLGIRAFNSAADTVVVSATSRAAIADDIFDEDTITEHQSANTLGKTLKDIIDDTANIQPKLGNPTSTVSGDILSVQGDTNDIQTRLPTALVGGRIDSNVSALNNSNTAAIAQASAAGTIVTATVATVTDNTRFTASGLSSESENYKGRKIIFTSGSLKDQATSISTYTPGSPATFIVVNLSAPPGIGDTFVIV
jgi:hypothetical protein